ncbi:MAG: hypothetical protein ACLTDR_07300 [Adlercreutzia equolifaciens]
MTDEESFRHALRALRPSVSSGRPRLPRRGHERGEELHERTAIDDVLLRNRMRRHGRACRMALHGCALEDTGRRAALRIAASAIGLSDAEIAVLSGSDERIGAPAPQDSGVRPAFKTVDTCAAEFPTEDRLPLQDLRR